MTILYESTRGGTPKKPFSHIVMQGMAEDGGLFVPEHIPKFTSQDLTAMRKKSYQEIVTDVFVKFQPDFRIDQIRKIIADAYNERNFDTNEIVHLQKLHNNTYLLELWHGPTCAFKDIALQVMPGFVSAALKRYNAKRFTKGQANTRYVVLVATSGDTGKAALEGYKNRKDIDIVVYYPLHGVSSIQEHQMVTQEGDNVAVYAMRGNFDDIQKSVKQIFTDQTFHRKLQQNHGILLSSANSINWGRLIPQIAYYIVEYLRLMEKMKTPAGTPIEIVVPTGNFGNVLAAFYARAMGLPVRKLLCASNENNALTEFIRTGIYDLRNKITQHTPSPAIDILFSNNIERLLYALTGNAQKVRHWFQQLTAEKYFAIDEQTKNCMQKLFSADFASNEETLTTIRHTYEKRGRLIDPHTAVAVAVLNKLHRRKNGNIPTIIAATAHWSKFGTDIYKALQGIPFDTDTVPELQGLSGFQVLQKIRTLCPDAEIPQQIATLQHKPLRFQTILDVDVKKMKILLQGL